MDFIASSSVTTMKTDGYSNWSKVTTSSWVFEKFFGFDIPVCAIFDRDYRCDEEIKEFLAKVNEGDVLCRFLPHKEIENFLIVPNAIVKAVERHSGGELAKNYINGVIDIVHSCIEESKSKTLSSRIGSKISYYVERGYKKDIQTLSAEEEKVFSEN